MSYIIAKNKTTSFVPKNLRSFRDTSCVSAELMPNDYNVLYKLEVRTTKELSHFEIDTSVKRVIKNVSRPKYVNFLEKEDVDQLNARGLLSQILVLIESKKTDSSILLIFRTIEKWMRDCDYHKVVIFLKLAKSIKLNEDIYVAILSSTLPWRSFINNREFFFEYTYMMLLKDYNDSKDEVEFILSGLK